MWKDIQFSTKLQIHKRRNSAKTAIKAYAALYSANVYIKSALVSTNKPLYPSKELNENTQPSCHTSSETCGNTTAARCTTNRVTFNKQNSFDVHVHSTHKHMGELKTMKTHNVMNVFMWLLYLSAIEMSTCQQGVPLWGDCTQPQRLHCGPSIRRTPSL